VDTEPGERLTIPLFPLHTVLFPGGPLPLRIFEPRYLEMVSRCLKTESGLGICLIREGSEVGVAPQICDVGTLSIISYWNKRSDGLLGITVRGVQRIRVLSTQVAPNQLISAEVELIPNEPQVGLPKQYAYLADLARRIIEQLEPPYTTMDRHLDDAGWVGARLTELLPLALAAKQEMLELSDPVERLMLLGRLLPELENAQGY
jgi:Lon protease-like protein